MTKKLFAALVALASMISAMPLAAQSIQEKNLVSGKEKIEADQGYIFLEAPHRYGGTFIRVPDAEDLESYQVALVEAVARESKRQAKKIERWEQQAKAGISKGDKPEPLDPSMVSIGMIEPRTSVRFGPSKAYFEDKAAGRHGYLTQVKPGTYIWYGPVVSDDQIGMVGQCFCMGSVRFEVKAGVITNLGTSLGALPDYQGQKVAPPMAIELSGGFVASPKIERMDGTQKLSYDMPQSLAQFPTEKAELQASGKMNNFYGLMISRLPQIDGILGYDRDTIIDLRTGERLIAIAVPQ